MLIIIRAQGKFLSPPPPPPPPPPKKKMGPWGGGGGGGGAWPKANFWRGGVGQKGEENF